MKLELEITEELAGGLTHIAEEWMVTIEDVAKLALSSYVGGHLKRQKKPFSLDTIAQLAIQIGNILKTTQGGKE